MKDIVGLNDEHGTTLVNVHTVDQCDGQPCCIHNPSNHHMIQWTPSWNDATGVMFRRCPHDYLHPDPDNLTHLRRINRITYAVHHCDGCCQPLPRNEIEGGTNGRAHDPGDTTVP